MNGNFTIIMERLDGSYGHYIQDKLQSITEGADINAIEPDLISGFVQILHMLRLLQHEFNFIHRDLHPDNIMLYKKSVKLLMEIEPGKKVITYGKRLKIIDLGLSCMKIDHENIIQSADQDECNNRGQDIMMFAGTIIQQYNDLLDNVPMYKQILYKSVKYLDINDSVSREIPSTMVALRINTPRSLVVPDKILHYIQKHYSQIFIID